MCRADVDDGVVDGQTTAEQNQLECGLIRLSEERRESTARGMRALLATETVLHNLERALKLLDDPQQAYLAMSDQQRRWSNQAYFERIHLSDDDTVATDLAAPFALMHRPELQAEARLLGLTEDLSPSRSTGEATAWPLPETNEPPTASAVRVCM